MICCRAGCIENRAVLCCIGQYSGLSLSRTHCRAMQHTTQYRYTGIQQYITIQYTTQYTPPLSNGNRSALKPLIPTPGIHRPRAPRSSEPSMLAAAVESGVEQWQPQAWYTSYLYIPGVRWRRNHVRRSTDYTQHTEDLVKHGNPNHLRDY